MTFKYKSKFPINPIIKITLQFFYLIFFSITVLSLFFCFSFSLFFHIVLNSNLMNHLMNLMMFQIVVLLIYYQFSLLIFLQLSQMHYPTNYHSIEIHFFIQHLVLNYLIFFQFGCNWLFLFIIYQDLFLPTNPFSQAFQVQIMTQIFCWTHQYLEVICLCTYQPSTIQKQYYNSKRIKHIINNDYLGIKQNYGSKKSFVKKKSKIFLFHVLSPQNNLVKQLIYQIKKIKSISIFLNYRINKTVSVMQTIEKIKYSQELQLSTLIVSGSYLHASRQNLALKSGVFKQDLSFSSKYHIFLIY